jgi:hypothetical protein
MAYTSHGENGQTANNNEEEVEEASEDDTEVVQGQGNERQSNPGIQGLKASWHKHPMSSHARQEPQASPCAVIRKKPALVDYTPSNRPESLKRSPDFRPFGRPETYKGVDLRTLAYEKWHTEALQATLEFSHRARWNSNHDEGAVRGSFSRADCKKMLIACILDNDAEWRRQEAGDESTETISGVQEATDAIMANEEICCIWATASKSSDDQVPALVSRAVVSGVKRKRIQDPEATTPNKRLKNDDPAVRSVGHRDSSNPPMSAVAGESPSVQQAPSNYHGDRTDSPQEEDAHRSKRYQAYLVEVSHLSK